MLRASCWRGVVKVLSCITIEHPSLRGDIQDKAECYSSSATLRLHRANTNESFGVQLYFSGPENIPTVYVTGVLPSLRRNCVLLSQLFPGGKVLQPQAVVLSAINGRVVHSAKSAEAMLRDDRDVTLQLAFTAQRDGDEDATKEHDKAHGDGNNKEALQHDDEVAPSHQHRRRSGSRQRNAASSSSSPSTLSRNRAAMPAGIATEGDAEHATGGVSSGPAKRGRKPKSATTTTTAALHSAANEKDDDEDVTWFERRVNAVVDKGIAADIAAPATAAGNARATSSSATISTHGRGSAHGTSAAGSAATDTPRRRGRPRKSSSSSAAAVTDTTSPSLSQPSQNATTTTAAKSTTTTATKATTSTPAAGGGPVTASPTSAAASSPAADDSDDLLAV